MICQSGLPRFGPDLVYRDLESLFIRLLYAQYDDIAAQTKLWRHVLNAGAKSSSLTAIDLISFSRSQLISKASV